MRSPKVSVAVLALALSLLLAPAAQAAREQITLPRYGELSPGGLAGIRASYACAPRSATTYLALAITQYYGPNNESYASNFETLSSPLICNGKVNKVFTWVGADNSSDEMNRFVLGPAHVSGTFWNDVQFGFGRVEQTVVLR